MSTELGNPQLDILDILSNLGEKSLVDVNNFYMLFHKLLTRFSNGLTKIDISSELLVQLLFNQITRFFQPFSKN